jgi:hypothetical protein
MVLSYDIQNTSVFCCHSIAHLWIHICPWINDIIFENYNPYFVRIKLVARDYIKCIYEHYDGIQWHAFKLHHASLYYQTASCDSRQRSQLSLFQLAISENRLILAQYVSVNSVLTHHIWRLRWNCFPLAHRHTSRPTNTLNIARRSSARQIKNNMFWLLAYSSSCVPGLWMCT